MQKVFHVKNKPCIITTIVLYKIWF